MGKINPLAAWTERDVSRRIFECDLPYHPLHEGGYASIGCAPCTQPGTGREGRWAGREKTQRGLHVGPGDGAGRPGTPRDAPSPSAKQLQRRGVGYETRGWRQAHRCGPR